MNNSVTIFSKHFAVNNSVNTLLKLFYLCTSMQGDVLLLDQELIIYRKKLAYMCVETICLTDIVILVIVPLTQLDIYITTYILQIHYTYSTSRNAKHLRRVHVIETLCYTSFIEK